MIFERTFHARTNFFWKKNMPKKKLQIPKLPPEIIPPEEPEYQPYIDPEDPFIPELYPDDIPEEDPFETPPIEVPPPGEGP
jgi:hypothetical protein